MCCMKRVSWGFVLCHNKYRKLNDAQGMDMNTWIGNLRNVQNEWGCQDVCKRKGIQIYKYNIYIINPGCNYIMCVCGRDVQGQHLHNMFAGYDCFSRYIYQVGGLIGQEGHPDTPQPASISWCLGVECGGCGSWLEDEEKTGWQCAMLLYFDIFSVLFLGRWVQIFHAISLFGWFFCSWKIILSLIYVQPNRPWIFNSWGEGGQKWEEKSR